MELEKIEPKFVTLSGTCKYCGQVRVVKARKECKESRDLVEMWNKREVLLVYIARLITSGDIKGANIKLDFENSISFSMTSGGKLKIKSTYKNEDGQSF